jgi:2-(1,2-epoxy-1,2-dihydrophenyl)acetyl-CoA isomerase
MYKHILFEREQGVARLTLNRPEVLNSFNRAMARELVHALDTIVGDDGVRAVLLTGAGRGFCAGQDLAEASPKMATTRSSFRSGHSRSRSCAR